MTPITVDIKPSGQVRYLHDDLVAGVIDPGPVTARRASHIEISEDGKTWYVDLAPVDGPTVGGFASRQQAVEYEEAWLRERGFPLASSK